MQTARTCLTAAERDPSFTVGGLCHANHAHLMPGGIALMKARQRISEILRIIPGSSLVVAPCDSDLAAPELAAELEETFGGGGYTAAQRAALLQLAADHVSSALDGRESAFELHASGGVPVWRGRLRRAFPSYNELANAVLRAIDLPMPEIDVSAIPPPRSPRAGSIRRRDGRQRLSEVATRPLTLPLSSARGERQPRGPSLAKSPIGICNAAAALPSPRRRGGEGVRGVRAPPTPPCPARRLPPTTATSRRMMP